MNYKRLLLAPALTLAAFAVLFALHLDELYAVVAVLFVFLGLRTVVKSMGKERALAIAIIVVGLLAISVVWSASRNLCC